MRLLSVVIAAGMLGACADESHSLLFSVAGVEYEVPAGHIQSFSSAPHQFIRIKAPDQPFDLAHDSRLMPHGSNGWPVVFSLNDGKAPNVEYLQSGRHKIVCRKASAPEGGCGLTVDDAGVKWSVLFPERQLAVADDLYARASKQLQDYRTEGASITD